MRAQEGVPAPLHLESSLQLGWNVLTVTKAVMDAAGNASPAAHIAESVFVVITSPSVHHHIIITANCCHTLIFRTFPRHKLR
jgi:hypothetical protein